MLSMVVLTCNNEPRGQERTEKAMSRQELEQILLEFCKWLERYAYLDSDWWAEKPTAIERYFEEMDAKEKVRQ